MRRRRIFLLLWPLAFLACASPTRGEEPERHWAWVAPQRGAPPQVADSSWPRNGVDGFILSRLEAKGLTPSESASRETLIRRVTLDLTGLPPTLAEIDAFLSDERSDAYERLVARLLASPRYGEHMAVAWLDAARFADTNGYNNDTPRYNWRYRDWVIEAFNRNLPYDRFVTEQIAGDLLPDATIDQKVASGFNRNHNVTSEGGIVDEEYRLEYVADRVHTTSTVFLALTMRCARCHDHKFDPISQREYYEFFAYFNQVPEQGYHKEHIGNVKPVISAPTATQSEKLARLESQLRDAEKEVDTEKRATKRAGLEKLIEKTRESVPTAMVMRELENPRQTFFLHRGAYDQRGDAVQAALPRIFPPLPRGAPQNRLGVARWLTRRDHPLTARVMVNRLWYQIFGRGLVETLEDFGTQGSPPSHPELLDWLALELVDSNWDVQHVLRLLVGSATYRQESFSTGARQATDPANRLHARGPRFRMTAEMIRDTALSAGGLLVERLGGPSVRPYQPDGLWVEVAVGDDNYSGGPYRQSHGDDLYRRSVYTWWKRTCPPPNLRAFDAPEREFCSVERSRTMTPLQALVLLNDPTFVEAARALAQKTLREGGSTTQARLRYAFRTLTARSPNSREVAVLSKALRRFRARFDRQRDDAKQLLEIGESPVEATLDAAELAAWASLTTMILNLDETITKG